MSEHLKGLHTRELLKYLERSRKFHGSYTPNDVTYYTTAQIKEELATREHIPNKAESKQLRQAKARAKKVR